jgi:hypothetical protein
LAKSDRWGCNSQPLDMDAFARFLAALPCESVRMKTADCCIIRFARPLAEDEAESLRQETDLFPPDEDPFDPRKEKTEAFLWWD